MSYPLFLIIAALFLGTGYYLNHEAIILWGVIAGAVALMAVVIDLVMFEKD